MFTKDKLTFYYMDGSTYTTKRNVILSYETEKYFVYEVETTENGIRKYEKFLIEKEDLIAVVTHRDNNDTVQLKLFKKDTSYGLSIGQQTVIDDEDVYLCWNQTTNKRLMGRAKNEKY